MQRRFAISFSILILWVGAASCAPAADFMDSGTPAETPAESPSADVSSPAADPACVSSVHPRNAARVTAVTDGDSFEIEMNGVDFRVRLIGLDAPEMGKEPLAEEARTALRDMLDGRQIIMVRDRSEADRYGRLLRFVFVDGVFVNREIIRLGLAEENPYPPDTACTDEFQAAEEEARQEGLGLWGLESVGGGLTDADGKACRQNCATPSPGCLIKGNINLEGEKIYHVPAGEYYAQTEIEPEKGERWFCSEAEAAAAGWRKSKR
jgi:micrococcal nuclease